VVNVGEEDEPARRDPSNAGNLAIAELSRSAKALDVGASYVLLTTLARTASDPPDLGGRQ